MQLQTISPISGWEQVVEVLPGEFGTVTISLRGKEGTVSAQLSQVEALSLARMIEEQVKDNRRK